MPPITHLIIGKRMRRLVSPISMNMRSCVPLLSRDTSLSYPTQKFVPPNRLEATNQPTMASWIWKEVSDALSIPLEELILLCRTACTFYILLNGMDGVLLGVFTCLLLLAYLLLTGCRSMLSLSCVKVW